MQNASSASRAWRAKASAVECTATLRMPMPRSVRRMRQAISPRLATRTLRNMGRLSRRAAVPDENADGGGVVRVAGVIELRAVRDEANDVGLGAKLDVLATGGDSVG